MATYRFPEWDLDIIDPIITWTFAGFNIEGDGLMHVDVLMVTDSTRFRKSLFKVGMAGDRSDEAIEVLMNALLVPYIVE